MCIYMHVSARVYMHMCVQMSSDQKKVLGAAVVDVCELHLVGAVRQTLALRFL